MKARMMMILMAVALIALPAMAQDWQSTSTMQGSGSAYSAQVTAVGAVEVTDMATTTETYSPSQGPARQRRGFDTGADGGQSSDSPVGDAVLPLMLMALAFGGFIAFKRRKQAANN